MARQLNIKSRRETLKHLRAFQTKFAKLKQRFWTENQAHFRGEVGDSGVHLRNTWKALEDVTIACECLCYEFNAWLFRSKRGERARSVDDNLRALSCHMASPIYIAYQGEWQDIVTWWNSLFTAVEAYCIGRAIEIPAPVDPPGEGSARGRSQKRGSGKTSIFDIATSGRNSSQQSRQSQQWLGSWWSYTDGHGSDLPPWHDDSSRPSGQPFSNVSRDIQ